jgi:hypothetical protein
MSQPPGTPDPNDPWASPAGQPGGPPEQPSAQPGYPPPYGYSPYGYGQPPYGQPPATNGKAIAAMWTGIGALVLSLCCGAGLLAGPVAIVLGVKGRSEIRAGGDVQGGDGMALAGIVTGALAVLLSLAVITVLVIAIVQGSNAYTDYETGV